MLPPTDPDTPSRPTRWYLALYPQVIAAIVLGIAVGYLYPATGAALKPLGDGFVKLVKMIIAPVIFLTIVTGIAGLRDLGRVGRIAGKALGYFLLLSTLALVIGLVVANVVRPGAGLNIDPATLDPAKVAEYSAKAHATTITGFVLDIIPDTLVSALTQGNILQVLFVAVLSGVALALVGAPAAGLLAALEQLSAVVFRLVRS